MDADRIFVKDGTVWTSAGLTAGIDLALALIEEDFDTEVAKAIAKDMVVYHQRPGGQSQFSTMLELQPTPGPIRKALIYARDHLCEPLTVELLADVACLSPRQFSRRFLNATGNSPIKAIELLRLEAARPRIEDEAEPLEIVARAFGFGDTEKMRRSCTKIYGRTPQELRRVARQNKRLPAG